MSQLPTRFLSREERALVALARAAIPPGRTMSASVDAPDLVHKCALMVAAMPPEAALGFRVGLGLFEWLSVLYSGRPFTGLAPERQQAWLQRWTESRFVLWKLLARLLLTVIKTCHTSRREVKESMGFPVDRAARMHTTDLELPASQVVSELRADTTVRCRVVVVGTGAGGAVMAAELAERGVDVVMIEAGRWHPASDLGCDPARNLRETYLGGGATIAVGRPSIPIPIGRTVGGTTTINSGTCFRVPEHVVEEWQRRGLPLSTEDLAPRYARVEERIHVQPVPAHLLGGSSHVIARGCEALGIRGHGPLARNIRDCRMSGVCAFGCPTNGKQSMNVTYVPRALEAGSRLYSGLKAERLLVEGGRAVGVEARPEGGGPMLQVRADVVVSACGTVPGVPFLKASGVRSRHLGRHLTIHPAAKIVALMPERVSGWLDTPQGYMVDQFRDEGIMFEGAFMPPEYASIGLPFAGPRFTEVMEDYSRLAVFGFLVSDEPNGRVFSGLGGRPVITYWLGQRDLQRIRRGLDVLSEIFFAAGAERVFLPLAGKEDQASLEDARRALSGRLNPWGLELTAFHPLGTARMAADRADGVVDPDLQCWEIPGLYVVDGSVFPSSLGVNPQLTIMAFATRAAEHIALELGEG